MGLFKQPEYRRFNPKPRYWDPEAEARKEREKQNWVCRKKEMNISPMSEPDCKRSMLNVKVNVVDCALVTQPVSL